MESPTKGKEEKTKEKLTDGHDLDENTNSSIDATVKHVNTEKRIIPFNNEKIVIADRSDSDCEFILDILDTCLVCVEGVEVQHQYEDSLIPIDTKDILGLSVDEATRIKLQIMEDKKKRQEQAKERPRLLDNDPNAFANILGDLNLCGIEETSHCISGSAFSCGENFKELDDDGDKIANSTETIALIVAAMNENGSNSIKKCDVCDCFDEPGGMNSVIELPCCKHQTELESNLTNICAGCILILCHPVSDGTARIGLCPRCKHWISATTNSNVSGTNLTTITVKKIDDSGLCKICYQEKERIVDIGSVCDACYLGHRFSLLYECEQCNNTQKIPHPMYRYQSISTEFGRQSWSCKSCNNFTMWRIIPDQIRYIPVGEIPSTWGENYLEVARRRVMAVRKGLADSDLQETVATDETCVLS